MTKNKFKKDFTTLEDVLGYIKNSETWGQNYTDVIVAALKARRKADGAKIKSNIKVGSTVGVAARSEYWLGTVTKVMKTRCAVKHMNNGLTYAVPMSMIDVKKAA